MSVSLSWAEPAAAQVKDAAAAEALFREGRALSDAGDIGGACEKFRESNRLDPAVGTTFNIADCEERLGRLARAWTLFDEVAQRLPPNDKRRALAHKRAAALEPRLPKLMVRLTGSAPEGSRVVRDGVELGPASQGTALPVDPGAHLIVVSAPGHANREYRVMLSEREHQTLEVEAGPRQAFPTKAAPEPIVSGTSNSAAPRSPTLGYVIGGVGVAGLITGAVTGVLLLQKKAFVDDHCPAKRCDPQGLEATKSGQTLGIVTTALLVTGVVGVGAGTYLVLSAGSGVDPSAASLAFGGTF